MHHHRHHHHHHGSFIITPPHDGIFLTAAFPLRSYGEDRFDEVLARELSKEGQRQLSVSEATAAKAAAHKLARYADANTTHPHPTKPNPNHMIEAHPHKPASHDRDQRNPIPK